MVTDTELDGVVVPFTVVSKWHVTPFEVDAMLTFATVFGFSGFEKTKICCDPVAFPVIVTLLVPPMVNTAV